MTAHAAMKLGIEQERGTRRPRLRVACPGVRLRRMYLVGSLRLRARAARLRSRGNAPSPWRASPLVVTALIGAIVAPVIVLGTPNAAERAAILAPTTRFDAAERWERLSGGSATNRKRFDRDAFSQPSANMPFEARAQFAIGNGLFRRPWVSSPSSTRSADGLGPLYNARSCQRCHLKDGRGHPPANAEDSAVSMLIRLSVPPRTEEEHALLASGRAPVIPEPTYGGQLQDVAVPGMAAEGTDSDYPHGTPSGVR